MNQVTRRNPRWLQSDVFGDDPRFLWPVSRLHREMNRLFSDAFSGLDEDGGQASGWTFNPVVDVEEQTTGQGEQQRSERIYGSFQRSFRLPDDAIEDQINARFADGVLTVSIPRDEGQSRMAGRRIEVQHGSRADESRGGERIEQSPSTNGGSARSDRRSGEERPAAGSE